MLFLVYCFLAYSYPFASSNDRVSLKLAQASQHIIATNAFAFSPSILLQSPINLGPCFFKCVKNKPEKFIWPQEVSILFNSLNYNDFIS